MLRAPAFADFRCDHPTSVGVSPNSGLGSLTQALRECGSAGSVTFRMLPDSEIVKVHCDHGGTVRDSALELSVSSSDRMHMSIPDFRYTAKAQISSVAFQQACRNLSEVGDKLQVTATMEGIVLSVPGSAERCFFTQLADAPPSESAIMTVHEPVSATFSLRYLSIFAKAAPLSTEVQIQLGQDTPLHLSFALRRSADGFMDFHLSPIL